MKNRKSTRCIQNQVESLESRRLLAATSVGIFASDGTASETAPTGAGQGEFYIKRLSGDFTKALGVKYFVDPSSTATSGSDFVALPGFVTIPAGKSSVFVKLTPVDDSTHESTENVVLKVKTSTAYTIGHASTTIQIADNDAAPAQNWWKTAWHYRTSITVGANGFARSDEPVDHSINFTDVLSSLGASGSFNPNSIRVVETNGAGTKILDSNVAFQFDQDSNFNAATQASGDLVFVVKGATASNKARRYDVYFDTSSKITAATIASQVTTTDNVTDAGMAAVEIQTLTATYFLQKANGGFSSILDTDGNDWLSYDPNTANAGGQFRGTPNAVFPGGGLHAGFSDGTTTILSSGPLKTTIESTVSVDKAIAGSPFTYKMKYEIYGTFVRATMEQADNSYWFLYEGTPGGMVNSDDSVVRSDGTVTDINTTWNDNDGLGNGADATASGGNEWAYFADSAVGKYIYFAHDTTDNLKDSYLLLNDSGEMTVFGFGRDNDVSDPNREVMTAQNNSFTFGIADGGQNFATDGATINGEYHDLAVTQGAAAQLNA
jgi:Calx-beta domain